MLSRIQHAIEGFLSVIGGLLVALMAFVTLADVFSRYVFNYSMVGVYELSEFLLVGAVYLGIARVQTERGHVRIEILTAKLPPRVRLALEIMGYLLGLLIFGLITWRTASLAWFAWETGDYSSGLVQWPMWPVRSVIPLGTLFLCLRLMSDLVSALEQFRALRANEPAASHPTATP